jgi:hypothetical protein
VGVHEKIPDAEFFQYIVYAGFVPALRQPDAFGGTSESSPEQVHGYPHLSPDHFVLQTDEGQKTMGGTAGDQFHLAAVEKVPEGS